MQYYRLHLPGHQYPDEDQKGTAGEEPRKVCTSRSSQDVFNTYSLKKVPDQEEPGHLLQEDRYLPFHSQIVPP